MDLNIFLRSFSLVMFFGLLQVLLLSNIELSELHITPYIYVTAILLLPFQTPAWYRLIVAFVLGLLVDVFSDTGGMHAFSLVLVAYLRPVVLNAIAPRDGYEFPIQPLISNLGVRWFAKYALIMLSIHHVSFFLLDSFSLWLFFKHFAVVLFTIMFSYLTIILSQFLVFRN